MTPDLCSNCGAAVPSDSRACPECGSDEKTGWSDAARAQQLDLPDDSFDYESFVREEFGEPGKKRIRPAGVAWIWWLVAIGLTLAFLTFWRRWI